MKCMKAISSSESRPEVKISSGVMLGKFRKTQDNKRFSSFTRIPYAKPPLGDLRFAKPEQPQPWDGILDASKPCPKPIQNNYVTGLLEGQEDCLYINVYKPEWDDDQVMIMMMMIMNMIMMIRTPTPRSLYPSCSGCTGAASSWGTPPRRTTFPGPSSTPGMSSSSPATTEWGRWASCVSRTR